MSSTSPDFDSDFQRLVPNSAARSSGRRGGIMGNVGWLVGGSSLLARGRPLCFFSFIFESDVDVDPWQWEKDTPNVSGHVSQTGCRDAQ